MSVTGRPGSWKCACTATQTSRSWSILCAKHTVKPTNVIDAHAQEQDGSLQKEAVFRIDNGNVRVKCLPKPEHFDEALLIFHVAHVGMELLAAAYPEHAEVKVIGAAKADSIKESSTSRTD